MRTVTAAVMFLSSAMPLLAQPPKPDRTWKSSPDGVEVLAATFLGGKGTEWCVAGGFQPDGSVVVVGNVLGPTLDLRADVGVIGTDLPVPSEPKPVAVLERGKPKMDADGKPVFEKPSWRHDGVTAFVALYSPDMKTLRSVRRFPWTAGAATAGAVDGEGFIYIAGKATDGIAKLGGDVAELPALKGDPKTARCTHSFVAKLSPDAAKTLWVRHISGPSAAPTVSLTSDGKVKFGAGQVHNLDAKGKLLSTIVVPGGLTTTSSVSPLNGTIAVGGEHHWPTGREPWRCPTLNVHNPDGSLKHQFYDWGGPYVGLDNCRQVSDTAVRYVTHDPDGGILLYLWSDGGNSVATTQPFDVREPVGIRGLGMTTAGAGVLSAAYLVRLDPKDYRVTSWTLWLANSPTGKPNSIWVEQLARVPDGSLAFAGKSAWGVWQTKDKLTEAAPEGAYIAVLTEDFSGLRYSSVVPGAGAAELNDGAASRGSEWAIATGSVKGKSRVLFLSGATDGRAEEDKPVATPTRNAAQDKFGGGRSDGYAILLDLAAPTMKPMPPQSKQPGPSRASFEAIRGRDPKAKQNLPDDGTVFHFNPTYPKWVTVDAELRDRSGGKWPAFLWGKPVDGSVTFRTSNPEAKLSVSCTALAQPNGEQDSRLLGSLIKDPKKPPTLTLSIESLGAQKSVEVKTPEKGKEVVRIVDYYEAKGTLELGGKKVNVAPKVTLSYSGSKNSPPDTVRLNAYITLEAREFGLTLPGSESLIDLRVGMSGTTRTSPPPKPKN